VGDATRGGAPMIRSSASAAASASSDPGRLLDHPHLCQLRAQLFEVAAAREVDGQLAHRDDRGCVAHVVALDHGRAVLVEHEPLP